MALAIVNHVGASAGGADYADTGTGISITSGALVIVGTSNYSLANDPTGDTVTDSAGNTYVLIGASTPLRDNTYDALWYAKNVVGGTVTFRYNPGSGTSDYPRIAVAQVSGADTAAPFDQGGATKFTSQVATAASLTSPAIDTTAADEILFAVCSNAALQTFGTFSDGGGTNNSGTWTVLEDLGTSNNLGLTFGYAIVAASGNYKVTASGLGGAGDPIVGIASFKAAGAAVVSFIPRSPTKKMLPFLVR